MDHPEGHDKKFKNAPQHETPKLDQSKVDHPKDTDQKFKDVPQHEAPELDQSKKQKNPFEGEINNMDRPKDPDTKFKGAPQHQALEPDQSKKHMNQSKGKVGYTDHPEGLDKNFKGSPQHEAPELDQSKKQKNQSKGDVSYMDQPEVPDEKFKGVPQHKAPEPDQSKKQMNQSKGEVDYMDHPKGRDQKFKGAPQHEALEPDQTKKQKNKYEGEVDFMNHPKGADKEFKGAPQHEAPEPDQSKKQMNQSEGEVDYMNHPKGPDKKFKDAPRREALEPVQSKKQMNQSEGKDTPRPAVKIANDKGKPSLHSTETGLGPQKVSTEVEDIINGPGLESISRSIPGNKKSEDSSSHLSATSPEQGKGDTVPKKKHFWSNWPVIGDASEASISKQPKTGSSKKSDLTAASQAAIPKQPEIDFPDGKQQEQIEVKVDTGPTEEVVAAENTPLVTRRDPTVTAASSKTLEILKSIVYGGLIESLASLSVVTSAASADATTLNIVALAFANLIGGLFVLGHNLEELKSEQVDRYIELLGQTENFILHAFIAVQSFIVFGLVPPVVYGFSFRESDDKDFKLAAVAAASLLCITLLSIAKAYIKRPSTYLTYFKTVLYYVSTGAVASVLSYLAGDLVKKLVEKLGWFESASNFALQIPGIGEQQPRWSS